MAAQQGKQMLLKKEDATTADTFNTMCGITSKSITLNSTPIDVTTFDCATPGNPLWDTSIGGGRLSVALSGDGIFTDHATFAEMNTLMLSGDARDKFQLVVPDFGTYEGEFAIENLTVTGEQEGAITFSTSLKSSGAITFTAA